MCLPYSLVVVGFCLCTDICIVYATLETDIMKNISEDDTHVPFASKKFWAK